MFGNIPRSDLSVITVTTLYYGADADLVRGFLTTPLEQSIASADGIDYMESDEPAGDEHDQCPPEIELRSECGSGPDPDQGGAGPEPVAARIAIAGPADHFDG